VAPLAQHNSLVVDAQGKAEILSRQYDSVFTDEDMVNVPDLGDSPYPDMPEVEVTLLGVQKLLQGINPAKACGPDQIPCRILKDYAIEISPILQIIFNQSLATGQVPTDWRTAFVNPIFKKGDRSDPANYRPVSLTCVCCKLLEHILFSATMKHLETHNILLPTQHGFRTKHSCESQLITTLHDLTSWFDIGQQIDMAILDFSKAFDSVPHHRMLHKLHFHGIRGRTLTWVQNWLLDRQQQVVIDGEKSGPVRVRSGVPQGTVLGPLLFLIYINDINKDITSQIRLFADDCLVYRPIVRDEDHYALQTDLDNLCMWSNTWQLRFNVKKCSILHIHKSRSSHDFLYTMFNEPLNCNSQHPYLGVILTHNLRWKPHINDITAKANSTLGFVRRNLRGASKEVRAKAYTSIVRPKLEYCSSVWDPHKLKHAQTNSLEEKLESVQRRAARFVTGNYKQSTSNTSLQQSLGWATLAQRRQQARLTLMYKAVNNLIAIPIHTILTQNNNITRGHNQRFHTLTCKTETYRASYFPRTVIEWNSLPEHLIHTTSVEQFKAGVAKYYGYPSSTQL